MTSVPADTGFDREPTDATALAAIKHLLADITTVFIATSCWLDDPAGSHEEIPAAADEGLRHIVRVAEHGRRLLAAEAADLAAIRQHSDPGPDGAA